MKLIPQNQEEWYRDRMITVYLQLIINLLTLVLVLIK